jgi:hypothetical protein
LAKGGRGDFTKGGNETDNNIGDAFQDGVLVAAEGRGTLKPFGLVGHQLLGGGWSNDEQGRQQRFVITHRLLHQHPVYQLIQALLSLRIDQHIRFCGCPRGRMTADTIQWHASQALVKVRQCFDAR